MDVVNTVRRQSVFNELAWKNQSECVYVCAHVWLHVQFLLGYSLGEGQHPLPHKILLLGQTALM